MKIIGITGSSGSGKTTFCKILSKRYNIKIIDADKVVRELSVPGTEYLKEIEKKFGTEILLEDGNLNRKLLAQKIYDEKNALETLNGLTFNYVGKEIRNRIEIIKKDETERFVAIDAPLLFESGLDKICDVIVGLIADKNIKVKRICARDNISEKVALKRLAIQQKDEFYVEKSNYVILNNEEEKLENEIEEFLNKIM